MKALAYLILTRTKNKILALRKKPGLMILYAFILVFIIAFILYQIFAPKLSTTKMHIDQRYMYMFLSGFGLLYLFTFTYSGISTGSTFFTMADVGLLFVAPISTRKILFYGLLSTIGKSMITSIFIFYQIPNLVDTFGFGFRDIVSLFIIYTVMIFFCQIYSIGIYIFSNCNQNRKNIVKTLLYVFFAILIIATYMISQKEQVGLLGAVRLLVDHKLFGYLPIVGWVTMFLKGILTGSIVNAMIALALFLVSSVLIVSLLTSQEADYYEDVLQSTEVTYQRLKDYKEGKRTSSNINRKVKVMDNDKGLQKGKGAISFAYKHLLEMKRSSRLIFVDNITLFTVIGTGIAGYSIKNEWGSYVILASLIYIQFFITIVGRLKLELVKPYIYMVPEPSFKKLVAASVSSLLKPCVDSIFIFGALALVGGASILDCIFMAIAYSSSGAVFLGLTLVYQRVLGGQPNKVAKVFIGIFLMISLFTPGVVVSILISFFVLPESLQFLSTLPYSIMSLLAAAIMFFACRNILDNAEVSQGM